MKHLKWLIPLAIVVLLLAIAIPAAADDPFGGPPSKTSGNGTTTWGAIYVGGTWDNKRDANSWYNCPNTFSIFTGNQATCEYDKYVTNWSASITIPGGASSRWFKFDTVKSRVVQIYLDDDPKWGAAYRYFDDQGCLKGVANYGNGKNNGWGDCDKADNLLRLGIDTSAIGKAWLATEGRDGIAIGNDTYGQNAVRARVYGPDYISRMNYFWPTPNNALLTTRSGTGISIADGQGSRGGYGVGGTGENAGAKQSLLTACDQVKQGDGNTHLMCGTFVFDGWVYVRAYNYMIWDNNFKVGTRFVPNEKYDFPCSNCPYPFDWWR